MSQVHNNSHDEKPKIKNENNIYTGKLYHGANDRCSMMSNAVAVHYTPERGRHLVAAEDIPAGALLMDEYPYAHCVYDQCSAYFCQNCIEPIENANDSVRCPKCKDPMVTYCSEACRDAGWTSFHQFDCGDVRRLLQCVGLRVHSVLLALRIIAQQNACDLIREYERLSNGETGEPVTDLSTDANRFASFMQLLVDDDQTIILPSETEPKGLTRLCDFIVEQLEFGKSPLMFHKDWDASVNVEQRCVVLRTMLLAVLKRLSRNRQGILEHRRMNRPEIKQIFAKDVDSHKASAVYPVAVLLNHSCVPNVYMVFDKCAKMQTRAITSIKKGEPLGHCYGAKFSKEPRAERQTILRTDYYFDCDCAACTLPEYKAIEFEMCALKCANCTQYFDSSDVDSLKCANCSADTTMTRQNVKSMFDNIQPQLASLSETSDLTHLLREYEALESLCHEHNKQLDETRAAVGNALIASGRANHAEPILIRHVTTTKRHTGVMSLRTALATSRLTCVYRETNNDKYWLTAALMIRIHLNHYGPEQVRSLFEENGLQHFIPAIDIIQNGLV